MQLQGDGRGSASADDCLSRQHNNANVLSLGARVLAAELAIVIVETWLATDFEGGRHLRRLAEIEQIEQEECGS